MSKKTRRSSFIPSNDDETIHHQYSFDECDDKNELEKYRHPYKMYAELSYEVDQLKKTLSTNFKMDQHLYQLFEKYDSFIYEMKPIVLMANVYDFQNIPVNGLRSLIRTWIKYLKVANKMRSVKLKKFAQVFIGHLLDMKHMLESINQSNVNNDYDTIRQCINYYYGSYDRLVQTEIWNPRFTSKLYHSTLFPFLMLYVRVALIVSSSSLSSILKSHYLSNRYAVWSLSKKAEYMDPQIAAKWIRVGETWLIRTTIKTMNRIYKPFGYRGIQFKSKLVQFDCPSNFTIKLTTDAITIEQSQSLNQQNSSSKITSSSSPSSQSQSKSQLFTTNSMSNAEFNYSNKLHESTSVKKTPIKFYVLKSTTSKKDKKSSEKLFSNQHKHLNGCKLINSSSFEVVNNNNDSYINNKTTNVKNTHTDEEDEKLNNNGLKSKSGLFKSKISFYTKLNANENILNEKDTPTCSNNNYESTSKSFKSFESSKSNAANDESTNNGKILIYMHGGAFFGPTCRSLIDHFLKDWSCRMPGVTIIAIESSYAPESTFPVAWQEFLDFYIWLVKSSPEQVQSKLGINVDPSKIVLAGDSSGGFLCLSLLVMLDEINHKFHQQIPFPSQLTLLFPKTSLVLRLCNSALFANYELIINSFMIKNTARAILPIAYTDEVTGETKLLNDEERKNLPLDWHLNLNYRLVESPIMCPYEYERLDSFKNITLNLLAITFDPLLDDSITLAKNWKGKVNIHIADDVCHAAFYYRQFAPCANQFNDHVLNIIKSAIDSV